MVTADGSTSATLPATDARRAQSLTLSLSLRFNDIVS